MLIVGIGEYSITDNVEETIITHALGSCVAFIVRCPHTRKTALAHIVLPQVSRREQYSYLETKPGYFADVIVPKLLGEFLSGNKCEKNQLQIFLAGGATSKNSKDIFRVGTRNVEMIKHLLKSYGLKPQKIEVGGLVSRTVEINVADGEVEIKSQRMTI